MAYSDRIAIGSVHARLVPMTDWREVPGFSGDYIVSEEGAVWSNTSNRVLKGSVNSRGYTVHSLSKAGVEVKVQLHRLVCEAFHGPAPEGKPYALHWDDNPRNNRADNLRWGSAAENTDDSKRNGTFNAGRWNGDMCRAGLHPWTKENESVNSSGRRMCGLCQKESWRRARSAGLPEGDPRHGTAYGGRRGCRCTPCVVAFRAARTRYRSH